MFVMFMLGRCLTLHVGAYVWAYVNYHRLSRLSLSRLTTRLIVDYS